MVLLQTNSFACNARLQGGKKTAGGTAGSAGKGALNAAARLFSKKPDRSMGAPIRRSKDPLTNLEIILVC